MERTITNYENRNAMNAAPFDKAASGFEKEVKKVQELSCTQLLKNLKKTNLRLLKINDISTMLLF